MSAWDETEAVFDAAIRKLHEYGEAALATRLNQVAMGQTMKVEQLIRANDQLGEHGRLMYAELQQLRREPK